MVVTSLLRASVAAGRRAATTQATQSSASSSSTPITTASVPVAPKFRGLRRVLLLDHKRSTPPPIEKPQDFVTAITKPRRGDLSGIMTALGGEESATLDKLKVLTGVQLKKAGLAVKDRRYALWCIDRYRQGQHPALIAYDAKAPKKFRGWGPRVQNGYRVRGVKLPGEK